MAAYYNEIDPFAAAWLRELIKAGLIADGEVDERSIDLVRPGDVRGFVQCHFFAGIGGWSYALRLAGWPDDRPVWTGSCPCQPFSAAGKGRGTEDPRHLWPQFRRLIRQCRPSTVFGEQVASKAGRVWLSAVFADLEALAYRPAGADLCGPCVGAYDIRQRLFFVADTDRDRGGRHAGSVSGAQGAAGRGMRGIADRPEPCGEAGELADESSDGRREEREERGRRGEGNSQEGQPAGFASGGHVGELGDTGRAGLPVSECSELSRAQRHDEGRATTESGGSFWADVEWLPCADGKWRPTQPGLFPLAARVPARVGRLRGYGNAIKPQVAAAFIEAYQDVKAWGRLLTGRE